MAAAVAFSTFVALTLSPVLASKILPQDHRHSVLTRGIDWGFGLIRRGYLAALRVLLRARWIMVLFFLGSLGAAIWLYQQIPQEYTPKEDRGAFFVLVDGPEGASFSYMRTYMDEIERRLMPYTESGEAIRLLVRAPRIFGSAQNYNSGIAILVLGDFADRRSAWVIMEEIRKKLSDLPGVQGLPGDAPGVRGAHPEAGPVRPGWRELRGAGGLAGHPAGGDREVQPGPHGTRLGLQGDQAPVPGGDRLPAGGGPGGQGRRDRAHPGDHARLPPGDHLSRRRGGIRRHAGGGAQRPAEPREPPEPLCALGPQR